MTDRQKSIEVARKHCRLEGLVRDLQRSEQQLSTACTPEFSASLSSAIVSQKIEIDSLHSQAALLESELKV